MADQDSRNFGVYEILFRKFTAFKSSPTDIDVFSFDINDSDDFAYKILNNKSEPQVIYLHAKINYYDVLLSHGADKLLQQIYTGYIQPKPFGDNHVSLRFDVEKLPEEPNKLQELASKAAELKLYCFMSVFNKYFDDQARLAKQEQVEKPKTCMKFQAGDRLFVKPSHDRVTVIYCFPITDANDVLMSHMFLKQLAQVKTTTGPQVIYYTEKPPEELRGDPDAISGSHIVYVTFVLFPRHTKPETRETTIKLLHSFRQYFHYQTAVTKGMLKSHYHRVSESFLKIMNRARPNARPTTGPLLTCSLKPVKIIHATK